MKKFTFFLLIFILVCPCKIFAQRGTIVEAVPVLSLTPAQIMANLQLELDETSYLLIDAFTYKKNPVNAVKIIYNTIDGKGNPTTASGMVFLPAVGTETYMPLFSYLHGTLTRDLDAPSFLIGTETAIGWIMAMDGYISVLPDYIGMGNGPGVHPYMHADSEASASIDMLKAATLLCMDPTAIAKPNGNLYLCGYSQGAHAALAVQRELEKNPLPNIALQKTIAGSGAYSLSFIQKNFLFSNPDYPNPSFLPYLMLGYQEVYSNLYSNLGQVFLPPYNTTIPGLFNGWLTVEEIDNQLPATWKSMFVPKYLWDIQYRYFHPVNIALRSNDLISWKPKKDLHLYYCNCDELVAKENSWLAYLSFILRGSRNVTCLPVGSFTHAACAPYVLLLAKIQFDCASGINPCGISLPLLASLTKSATTTDLSMFETALNGWESLDANQLMKNKELAAYFDIETVKTDGLNVYPNPARDIVHVEIPVRFQANSSLNLYDVQGKLVWCKNVNSNLVQLDVNKFQPGVYKVVLNGSGTLTGSLVVAK